MSQPSGQDTGERRGPGRPAGSSPETEQRWHDWRMLRDHGVSAAKIAERAGVSPQAVSNALNKVRPEMADADPPSGGPVRESQPRPKPRRLSEGKLAHRAVLALRRDIRFPAMPATRKLLWLDCVMEIHALGDDDGLSFGKDGDPFETHEEFASALGGTGEDLEALLRRGLLARLPDGGIDLPAKIGLKPKEKPRLVPRFGGMGSRGMFHVLPGGLPESTETPNSVDSNSTENPISVDSLSTETPISVASGGLARGAYVTVSTIESKEGSTSHTKTGNLSRATTESTETPISVESTEPSIPVEESGRRVCESSAFDKFWQLYPRKDDKGHARRAWTAAICKASVETIIKGVGLYPFSGDPRYIPMPATWLNGERWLPVETPVKWTPDQWFDEVLRTGPYAPGADDPIIDGTAS